jgi:hypothetical protein
MFSFIEQFLHASPVVKRPSQPLIKHRVLMTD